MLKFGLEGLRVRILKSNSYIHVKINRLYRVPGSIPAVNKWGSGIDPRAPFIDRSIPDPELSLGLIPEICLGLILELSLGLIPELSLGLIPETCSGIDPRNLVWV